MNNQEFNELAGKIEAVARLSTAVVAVLEDKGIIDGLAFSKAIRGSFRLDENSPSHFAEAQKALNHMADVMDSSRDIRRKLSM